MTPDLVPLGPPPRRARLRRGLRSARRGYRTLIGLAIVVFAGWAVLDGIRWYDLAFEARTATGAFRRKTLAGRFEYEFTTEAGDVIEAFAEGPSSILDAMPPGGPLPVVYLPSNPRLDHWLFDNDSVRIHARNLAIGHGLAALLAVFVLRFIEKPLRRELRFARRGEVARGQLTAIRLARRRRGLPTITYAFQTASGVSIDGVCRLPRRVRVNDLTVGMPIEVLYEPRKPGRNKPRLAFDYVDFGPLRLDTPGQNG